MSREAVRKRIDFAAHCVGQTSRPRRTPLSVMPMPAYGPPLEPGRNGPFVGRGVMRSMSLSTALCHPPARRGTRRAHSAERSRAANRSCRAHHSAAAFAARLAGTKVSARRTVSVETWPFMVIPEAPGEAGTGGGRLVIPRPISTRPSLALTIRCHRLAAEGEFFEQSNNV